MPIHSYEISTIFPNGVEILKLTELLRENGIDVIGISKDETHCYVNVNTSLKTSVDSLILSYIGPNSLLEYKNRKFKDIDDRTGELISKGFQFAGKVFSLSLNAQAKMMGLNQVRSEPEVVYPIRWNTKDDNDYYDLVNADAVRAFYLTGVGTYRAHVDAGTVFKDLVRNASSIPEVDAIVDNR